MSENLDLVRSIPAAHECGDCSSAEPRTWNGVAGMADCWRNYLSAWNDYRGTAERYSLLDDGRVLVTAVLPPYPPGRATATLLPRPPPVRTFTRQPLHRAEAT